MTQADDAKGLLEAIARGLGSRGWRLATAESCTGGMIAAACTSLAGSSLWFERGFVTYSNEAKVSQLGVEPALIDAHGAVSEAVALAMADGVLARSPADIAVAVTGIAGPGGAVPGKPVGTVWLAWARRGQPPGACRLQLQGDRAAIREATVVHALGRLLRLLESPLASAADTRVEAVALERAPAPGLMASSLATAPAGATASHLDGLRVAIAIGEAVSDRDAWCQALRHACPGVRWATELAPGERFDAAVVAQPAPGALAGLRGLGLIQSLWAGVDRLLQDPTLPAGVPLARMVDPAMTTAMAESAAWAVLSLHRGFFTYAAQQRQGLWRQHPQRRADEVPVTVLGFGVMGQAVAARLAAVGYRVTVWHRAASAVRSGDTVEAVTPGVRRLAGAEDLPAALAQAEIVINLLPLTPDTAGLLGRRGLAALPRGAAVVNFGRGGHMHETELRAMLDDGSVGHAVLDVFPQEPLPSEHPLWRHPRVTVLPHVAALTDRRSAAAVVIDNLERLVRGLPPRYQVDRGRGY